MRIREEQPRDAEAVRAVNRAAFGGEDEPSLVEALHLGGYVRLSLVAEQDGAIVGHVLLSEIHIQGAGDPIPALSLAPMAVLPDFQRQGVGSALIREALRLATERGHAIVLVLGHPEYYPRFGFSPELALPLRSEYAGPAFMALELVPGALAGVSGEVVYSPPFQGL